ncbi:uncharacterized protein LOC135397473 [Ornithodoros turicata]|uniref:uncharacterized protein LOC135397473 n=1 Tax=Ornithodoros turicata TaxID=34597 RepID=UPI003139E881
MPAFLPQVVNFFQHLLALTTVYFAVKLPLDRWVPLERQIAHVPPNGTSNFPNISLRSLQMYEAEKAKCPASRERQVTAVMIYPVPSWIPKEADKVRHTQLQPAAERAKDHSGFLTITWTLILLIFMLLLQRVKDEIFRSFVDVHRETGSLETPKRRVREPPETSTDDDIIETQFNSLRDYLWMISGGPRDEVQQYLQEDDAEPSDDLIEEEDNRYELSDEDSNVDTGDDFDPEDHATLPAVDEVEYEYKDFVGDIIQDVFGAFAEYLGASLGADLIDRHEKKGFFGDLLNLCEQRRETTFTTMLHEIDIRSCIKIGESRSGDVFRISTADGLTVLKLHRADYVLRYRDQLENHIRIARSLEVLSNGGCENYTEGFIKIFKVRCVWDSYPALLLNACRRFQRRTGGHVERMYADVEVPQPYVVIYMKYGGSPLSSIEVLSAPQLFSILQQTVLTIAAAESELSFEHRDLRLEHIYVLSATERSIQYKVGGKEYAVGNGGVEPFVGSFAVSRVQQGEGIIWCDPEVTWSGREVHEALAVTCGKIGQNIKSWNNFYPRSNVLFLEYVSQELYKKFDRCVNHNISDEDRRAWKAFQEWSARLAWFPSTAEFVKVAMNQDASLASRLSWFF